MRAVTARRPVRRPRRMTVKRFLEADLPEGKFYELVEGVLDVSPCPELPHDLPLEYLRGLLKDYQRTHPERLEYVSTHVNLVIPGRPSVRLPDLVGFKRFRLPDGSPPRKWTEVSPTLIVEVVSPEQDDRDYRDKRRDYLRTSAQEYWIIDPQRRHVLFLRRKGNEWEQNLMLPGDIHTTPLLPGLKVPVQGVLGT